MATITPLPVYHARPGSAQADILKQDEARRAAERRGDNEEAARCFDRKQAILTRLADADVQKRRRNAIVASPRPGKRDPLATYPDRLRRAADILRDQEQAHTLRLGPGFALDYVEGGQSAGMEAMIDRRTKHRRAWQRCFEALDRPELEQAIYNITVFRCSIASQLVSRTSGAERRLLANALYNALETAAGYFDL